MAAVRAAVRISEDGAKRVRKHFVRSMLKEFNRIAASTFPEVASALRKEQAAQARKDYQRNLAQERLRTATFKASHPEMVNCYHETRQERMAAAGYVPKAAEASDASEQLAKELETQMPPYHIIWNDHRPRPSADMISVAEFVRKVTPV